MTATSTTMLTLMTLASLARAGSPPAVVNVQAFAFSL